MNNAVTSCGAFHQSLGAVPANFNTPREKETLEKSDAQLLLHSTQRLTALELCGFSFFLSQKVKAKSTQNFQEGPHEGRKMHLSSW